MNKKGSGRSRRSAEEAIADVASAGTISYIADHYAYTCDCGSVNFNLLKSGRVECSSCGELKQIEWRAVNGEAPNWQAGGFG